MEVNQVIISLHRIILSIIIVLKIFFYHFWQDGLQTGYKEQYQDRAQKPKRFQQFGPEPYALMLQILSEIISTEEN